MSSVLEYWMKKAQVKPDADGSFWELRWNVNETWSVFSQVATLTDFLAFDHWGSIKKLFMWAPQVNYFWESIFWRGWV